MDMSPDLDKPLPGWEAPVYYGEPHENARIWLDLIQAGCEERSIAEGSYPAVSRRFLGEKAKTYITKCERSFTEISPDFKWNWKAFKLALVAMTHTHPEEQTEQTTDARRETLLGEAWNETRKLISDHPVAARAAGSILLAASAPIIAPVASAGALSMLGIGSAGPIVGSLAATLESAAFGVVSQNPILSVAQTALEHQATLTKTVAAMLVAVFAAIRRWFSRKGKGECQKISTDN